MTSRTCSAPLTLSRLRAHGVLRKLPSGSSMLRYNVSFLLSLAEGELLANGLAMPRARRR
jgi:hypothetical protein